MDYRRWLAVFLLGLGGPPSLALAGDCGCDQPCFHHRAAPLSCPCPYCNPVRYPLHNKPRKQHHHFGAHAPPVAPVMQTVVTQAAAVVAQPAIPVQPALLTQPNLAAMQQLATLMAQQKTQAGVQADKSCGQAGPQSSESVDELKELLRLFRESLVQPARSTPATASSGGSSSGAASVSPPASAERLERLTESLDGIVQQRQAAADVPVNSRQAATDARIKQLADQMEAMQRMLERLVEEREREARQPRP